MLPKRHFLLRCFLVLLLLYLRQFSRLAIATLIERLNKHYAILLFVIYNITLLHFLFCYLLWCSNNEERNVITSRTFLNNDFRHSNARPHLLIAPFVTMSGHEFHSNTIEIKLTKLNDLITIISLISL